MVVIVRESTQNALNSGSGIMVICVIIFAYSFEHVNHLIMILKNYPPICPLEISLKDSVPFETVPFRGRFVNFRGRYITWIFHMQQDPKRRLKLAVLRDTVDGSEILHQLRLVVHPIIYKGLYIFYTSQVVVVGFLPSTVSSFWLHAMVVSMINSKDLHISTLPDTYRNRWLEDPFPFGMAYFRGELFVSGSVGMS